MCVAPAPLSGVEATQVRSGYVVHFVRYVGPMKMLRVVSTISVLCTVPILLFVVPQLVVSGMVEVGQYFELLVVFPTVVGLPCAFAGAVAGTVCVLRQRTRGTATVLMALGQVTTVALAAVIVVWAFGFASTGWELITLPTALMVDQLIVAAGLIGTYKQRGSVPA